MTTLRIDDISVPLEARTFDRELTALGPDYEILITVQESEWIPFALEHIKVFIETSLGVAAISGLSKRVVDFFLAWAKEQRLKRPEQTQKKLSIYGPDGKIVKVITVKGDHFEEQ